MESGSSCAGENMNQSVSLSHFNGLQEDDALATLEAVCSSKKWVAAMLELKPFEDRDHLLLSLIHI